jgi:diguanylate cyclase (GGDEF)-like protein/PAS domain S-box-containing protein
MRIQAEANLSALIESTVDLIWSVDLDYRLVAFNKAFLQNVEKNYGAQIGVGMRLEEALPPERAALWPTFYARALSEGPFRVEYSLTDGRTLEMAFSPIVVAGKATGVSVFGKDITERKAAEEKYRAIFDGALEGMFQTSLEGRFLTANPALAKILGYSSPDELLSMVGNTTHDVWANPNERSLYLRQLEEHGAVLAFECQFKRKDGTKIWVSLNTRQVYGADGWVLHLEGFLQEISDRKQAAIQLRDSEERYRTAFQTSLDSININRLSDGVYIEANKAFLDITGYERQEIIGKSSLDLNIWADQQDRNKLAESLHVNSVCRSLKAQFRVKSGKLFWGLMSASVIELDGVPCLLSITRDITDAKLAEESLATAQEALRANEERYRTVFQMSIDCITISRLSDGRYIDVNKAFLNLLGIKAEEIVGRTSTDLGIWASPKTRSEILEMLHRDSGFRDYETEFIKKTGERLWVLISASIIELGGVSCIVSVMRDISDAKAAEKTIQNLAFYDPLTGLPNRRLLLERLHQVLDGNVRSGRSRALLFIDLDDFKTLNDTLGHHTGDILLQQVARRIVACVPEAESVGRPGGDEFVVMLEDLSEVAEEAAAQAKAVGERILASISQPYVIENRECLSSASIGITVFGNRKYSTSDILQQADIALHQAKSAGRTTLRFFSPALQAAVNARATLEEELRQAIKKKQFLLYYQPQVERGHLTGAEALIRWKHPTRGIVLPNDFIPLTEESRLILPLGKWVLETACKQIAAWAGRKETAGLTLAVNISALQFRQPEFVELVLAVLQRTGANPKNLKLELTESMLVENFEDVIAKMTELKSHGLSFSLDDFGTGYSSLAYLKRLPLDQLKIDRAFVRDMLVDATSGAIAQTIISLGRAMDLSVVAEGVETEEQRGFLAGLGCHSFQGYLFSRPVPLDELTPFL